MTAVNDLSKTPWNTMRNWEIGIRKAEISAENFRRDQFEDSSPRMFSPGQTVKLNGMRKRKELNGTQCEVLSPADPDGFVLMKVPCQADRSDPGSPGGSFRQLKVQTRCLAPLPASKRPVLAQHVGEGGAAGAFFRTSSTAFPEVTSDMLMTGSSFDAAFGASLRPRTSAPAELPPVTKSTRSASLGASRYRGFGPPIGTGGVWNVAVKGKRTPGWAGAPSGVSPI
jgi:hypothetical protein